MSREIITNKLNLPLPIVNAVSISKHQKPGEYSVTQLIDAPKPYYLRGMYDHEVDASDKIWALLGSSAHAVLELASLSDDPLFAALRHIAEAEFSLGIAKRKEYEGLDGTVLALEILKKELKKLALAQHRSFLVEDTIVITTKVKNRHGEEELVTVSGSPDLYQINEGIIWDYKVTSVWNVMNRSTLDKWTWQVNIYRLLLKYGLSKEFQIKHKYEPKEAFISVVMRDWSKHEAAKNSSYPQKQVELIPVEIYPEKDVIAFLMERLSLHHNLDENNLPDCTSEERWEDDRKFSIIKKGASRATRNFPTLQEAEDWFYSSKYADDLDYRIVERPGISKRCEGYCPVNMYCEQFKRIKLESDE